MKNRNLIQKEYFTKIKELKEHNKQYYEKSNPKVSDGEYDKLKKEILDLEKKYLFLKSKYSPSLIVGAKPSKNLPQYVAESDMRAMLPSRQSRTRLR